MTSQGYASYRRDEESYEEPPPPYEDDDSSMLNARGRGGEFFHAGYGGMRGEQFRDQRGNNSGNASRRSNQAIQMPPLGRPKTRDQADQGNFNQGYGRVNETQNRAQGPGYSGGPDGRIDRFVGRPPLERPKTRDRSDRADFRSGYGEVSKQHHGNQGRDYPGLASGARDQFASGASLERPQTSHERGIGAFRDDSWAIVPPFPNQGGKSYDDTFGGRTRTHDERRRENSHNGCSEARQFPGQLRDYPDNTAPDGRARRIPLAVLPPSPRLGTSYERIGGSFQNDYEAPMHPSFSDQQRSYPENANWGQFAAANIPRRPKTGHGDRDMTYGGREGEPSLPRMRGNNYENVGWEATAPAPWSKTQDQGRSTHYKGGVGESPLPYQRPDVFDDPRSTARTRDVGYRPRNREDREIRYPNQVLPMQQIYRNTDAKASPITPSSHRLRTRDAERGGEYNGRTMDFQISYQALPAQNSQDDKEMPKSFTIPPPPIPSDNVDNGTSQFRVARKPLRSYKSSPEVNVWAQDPKDQCIHKTQQARDIQAQRIIRNGNTNAPPLPPRPELSLKTSIPPRLTESQIYLSPSTASTTPSRSMSRTPSLSGETLVDTPLTAVSSVDHIDKSISTTTFSTTSEVLATTTQDDPETTSPSSSTLTLTSTTTSLSTSTSESKTSKFKDGMKNRIEAGQKASQKSIDAVKAAAQELEKTMRVSFVSERDFSILRHSYPLVPYRGTATCLIISIFATNPLPEDRKFWMQQKGYSGDAGMAVKGWLGRTGDWIDVTPSMCVSADKLNKEDEESFNKDIALFKGKATTRTQTNHEFRETCVLHIPVVAEDGYYQLVLCRGNQKKLCTSPIFRLASASMSPSSMRGASPLTMPLEVGAMAGGVWAKAAASAFAATAAAPVTGVVVAAQTKVVGKVGGKITSAATSKIATKVMNKGGEKIVEQSITKVKQGGKEYASKWAKDDGKRAKDHHSFFGGPSDSISEKDGPTEPYPIHFTARNQTMYTHNIDRKGETVSTTIKTTPDNISFKLTGTYIGWCRFKPDGKPEAAIDNDWHKIFISVLPIAPSQLTKGASLKEIQKKVFTLQIIDDLLTSIPQDCHVEIYTLARCYEDLPERRGAISHGLVPCETALFCPEKRDRDWLDELLEGDKWKLKTVEKMRQSEQIGSMKRMASNISGVMTMMEGQLDKVDIGKFGVRLDSDLEKDIALGASGFYVQRDV
ncbi:hypothetical protein BJ875DRAFT_455694 [Amylocarpus encephaloides]|uniref:Uncharacterized protein n=1 Tax=Amylocarpus encephaloides TaxID=45428 RepID=A0A9P7YPD6_9HELO|nr:hypothetical protein BJ875DRAFT_455694 [Amylocarpus encephaloides]